MELTDLIVPAFVIVFGYAVMSLGRWMMRRPERLEEVVWPDPKPVERRDLSSTKRVGSWLIFLGPLLSFMIIGIGLVSFMPSPIRTNPISFPLIMVASIFAAYRLRKAVLYRHTR